MNQSRREFLKTATLLACQVDDTIATGNISVETPAGTHVVFRKNGQYMVHTVGNVSPFTGHLDSCPTYMKKEQGTDPLGEYNRIVFSYADGVQREGSISVYQAEPAVFFRTKNLSRTENTNSFPKFTRRPDLPYHLNWTGWDYTFDRFLGGASLFFDDTGNAYVLSPASHFPVSCLIINNDNSAEVRVDSMTNELPENYEQSAVLVACNGIGKTIYALGRAILKDVSQIETYNNIWTDYPMLVTAAGSELYYCTDKPGEYPDIIMGALAAYEKRGVPVRSGLFNSWTYRKGKHPGSVSRENRVLPSTDYVADETTFPDSKPRQPGVFPDGYANFRRRSGIEHIRHTKGFVPGSPRTAGYEMSGGVPLNREFWGGFGEYFHFSLGVSKRPENLDMDKYLQEFVRQNPHSLAGIVEFDWLDDPANSPAYNLRDHELYREMATTEMVKWRLGMLLCRPNYWDYMPWSNVRPLTMIRPSHDGFDGRVIDYGDKELRSIRDQFIINSHFADALGLVPFADAIMNNNILDYLIAALSRGPLGVGRRYATDADLVRKVIFPDGIIQRPGTTLIPTDSTYIAMAKKWPVATVAYSNTPHGDSNSAYVIAYEPLPGYKNAECSLEDINVSGPAYVLDKFAGEGEFVDSGFRRTVDSNGRLYVVSPVGRSEIAFLGDSSLISLTPRRFHVENDSSLNVGVNFFQGEREVMVHGYSPSAPIISVDKGEVRHVYDRVSKIFTAVVSPENSSNAMMKIKLA